MNYLDANFTAFYLTYFEVLKVYYITLVEIFWFENCSAILIVNCLDDLKIRSRS